MNTLLLTLLLKAQQTPSKCPPVRHPVDENGKVIFNYIITEDCKLINLDKRENW